MVKVVASILVLLSLSFTFGCSSSTTQATTNPGITTTAPASSGSFSQLAELGSHVYSNSCARCHGANGQGGVGPTIVGNPNTHLAYPTAAVLLSKISTTMPQDKPGTLSQTEYYQVLSYLLVQNQWVNAADIFNSGNLAQIILR